MALPSINARTFLKPRGNPLTAKAIFVGDYPNYQEIKTGNVLEGAPGRIFQNSLMTARLSMGELYFTNVIKTIDRPLHAFWDKKARFFESASVEWLNYLKEEIKTSNAKFILAAGDLALSALADRDSLYNWRGSVVECALDPNKWVIPIFHPNTIPPPTPQPLNHYLLTFDLCRLAKWIRKGDYQPEPYEIKLNPSFLETIGLLNELKTKKLLAVDIEVFNQEMSCISFSPSPNYSFCIPFVDERGTLRWTPEEELEIMILIAEILENPSIEKLGQNLSFDAHFLLAKYGIHLTPIQDTMVAQQIIMPDFKKGLDFITSIHTDLPYHKDEGKQWFKVGGAWETLWHYNALDSLVCMIAFKSQTEDIIKQKNVETYDRQRRIIEPLVFMQERGIRCDMPNIRRHMNMLEKEIESIQKELNELAGEELNSNSPKQLQEYFYGKKKQKAYTKKGSVTVDEKALKRLAIKGFKEASLILRIRKNVKLISTYLEPTKYDSDGRWRCSYNPVGTRYSRISSSENIFGTGGNGQNKPHAVQFYQQTDEDYIGYAMDLSQAENRIVAYLGKVQALIKAFEEEQDVHSLTASYIFGGTAEEIKKEDDGKITCRIGDGTHTKRFFGKKSNHGLNYDLHPDGFSLQLEVPRRDAELIYNKYHASYPGIKNNFHRGVQNSLRQNRVLENLRGRKTTFLGPLEDATFKEAYSCIPQGTVGDIINEFGMNYIYYNQELFEPVELLTQIHDEIVFQIPAPWHPETPVPWEEHARMLQLIKKSLEVPLHCNGYDFFIPVDTTMFERFKCGVDMKSKKLDGSIEEIALLLEEIWPGVQEKTQKELSRREEEFTKWGV